MRNPDNAVGNAHDRAFVARFGLEIHRRDALLNNVADLGGFSCCIGPSSECIDRAPDLG